jgi:hypothetical protein
MDSTTHFIGRPAFFVGYALVSIAAGILNMVYLALLGGNAIQWLIFVELMGRDSDESILKILLSVLTSTETFFTFQFCLVAPFVLVALAFVRGRQLRVPHMVVFPLIGLVVTCVGAFPFVSLGDQTAIAAPSVITWLFDGWCLYLGLQPNPIDQDA